METITLKVTSGVLNHANNSKQWNQTQIAIVKPKFKANAASPVNISIGGVINLVVGDTHAIWHSHNNDSELQKKNFERLFALLANNPDKEVEFLYNSY